MADTSPHPPSVERDNGAEDRSVSELVKALSEQSSRLARQEVELAKAELAAKGRHLGLGAGAFGAAGLVGVLALGALTATLILALAEAVEPWIAAGIVALGYAAIAGVLALAGKRQVDEGSPPVPERTIDSSQQDLETIKERAKEGRA